MQNVCFFVKGVIQTALDVLNHFQSCSKRSPPIPNRQFFCNRMYFYLTLCVPSFSLYLSLVLSYITLEGTTKSHHNKYRCSFRPFRGPTVSVCQTDCGFTFHGGPGRCVLWPSPPVRPIQPQDLMNTPGLIQSYNGLLHCH